MIIAIAGDLHGALDALYERLKSWEVRWGMQIELVLQCGDLGAFGAGSHLDRKAKKRWAADPSEMGAAEYLAGSKRATHPTWFVRGNNEDFEMLSRHPGEAIDPAGWIRHLAGGRVYTTLDGNLRIAALGGIQPRRVKDPELPKYVQKKEVDALLSLPEGSVDILLTHDGPIGRSLQGFSSAGSIAVYDLVKHLRPRWHFFGHYHNPHPPFELHGCRSVCMNQPGSARLPSREGAVARLDLDSRSLAWIDAGGVERPI